MVVVDSLALIPLARVCRLDLVESTFDDVQTTAPVRQELLTEGKRDTAALDDFLDAVTRIERKPTPEGVGGSDTTACCSTAIGRLHPQSLFYRKAHREIRKTAKSWRLDWGVRPPDERPPHRPLAIEGVHAAREGRQNATLRRLGTHRHTVWRRVGSMARPAASGAPRGYGRWEWIRPARANTPDPIRGQTSIP